MEEFFQHIWRVTLLLAFTLTFRISLACESWHCHLGPHGQANKSSLELALHCYSWGEGDSKNGPTREKSLKVDSLSRPVFVDFLFRLSDKQALRLDSEWGPVSWKSNIDKQPGKQGKKQGPGLDDSSTFLESGVLATGLNSSPRLHPGSIAAAPQHQISSCPWGERDNQSQFTVPVV